jgi:Holliday junction resolvasome RuvABC endonuclease subunit
VFLPGDIVAIEGLSFGSSYGKAHLLNGAHAIWLDAAFHQTTLVFVVPPQRVKIWAVNTSKVKKAPVIAWAREQLQIDRKVKISEHEADALSLAQIARAAERRMRGRFVALTPRQQDILQNKKGDGVIQKPDLSFYRGQYGKGYETLAG